MPDSQICPFSEMPDQADLPFLTAELLFYFPVFPASFMFYFRVSSINRANYLNTFSALSSGTVEGAQIKFDPLELHE
jgi:hypothetical protein